MRCGASGCGAGRGSGLPYGKAGHSGRWAGTERKRAVQEFAGGLVGAGCWAHAERKQVGRAGLGWVFGLGLPFLFLIQTKLNTFEFKFEFEFKPHSDK